MVKVVERLRPEQGMALPLALGIMMVLTISVAAVIEFSSSSSRGASLNTTRQSAKALAEGGVAHGASVLAQELETSSTYTGSPSGTASIQGVSVPWWATYETGSSPPAWLVRATAAQFNPTGPAASDVSRTVQAKFEWLPISTPALWHGLYVGNPGTVPLMSNAESSIATDVYVRGNLTMTQGKFLGSSFQVWGSLTLDSGGMFDTSIGASDRTTCSFDYRSFKTNFPGDCVRPSAHRVSTFKVKDGCRFNTSDTPTAARCSTTSQMGGPSGKIWLTCPSCPAAAPSGASPATSTDYTSTAFSSPPDDFTLTAPDVPPATWHLGPGKPCVNGTNAPSFTASSTDIMGSSSYSCVSPDGAGELSWNASTNTLTARGVIYFEGQLELQSGRHGLVAPGEGSIYVRDKLLLKPGTGLCGLRAATAPRCDSAWDPPTAGNIVSFMVGSDENEAILQDSFHFQGGLYTDQGGYFVQNDSSFKGVTTFEGPVRIQNNGTIDAWSPSSPTGGPTGGAGELTLVPGSWSG